MIYNVYVFGCVTLKIIELMVQHVKCLMIILSCSNRLSVYSSELSQNTVVVVSDC